MDYIKEKKNLESSIISQKTHDRFLILNKLRRFGTHHKTGATLKDDALYSFALLARARQSQDSPFYGKWPVSRNLLSSSSVSSSILGKFLLENESF